MRKGNKTFSGNAMALAFKKISRKFRVKKARWPRRKGPRGIRVEMKTGYAVAFA